MNTPTHDAERARLKRKNWIQTFSGKPFTPLAPDPAEVDICDIAHALSMKCRYTGHTRAFYSVAEHCVRVSYAVPSKYALAGLMHDAGEAYLPDVAAPIKGRVFIQDGPDRFVQFAVAEARVLNAIFVGLGLTTVDRLHAESEFVKKADLQMLATEVRDLMGDPPDDWGFTEKPFLTAINPWTAGFAEQQFLARFGGLQ